MITVLFLVKKSQTSIDVWASTSSCCKNQWLLFSQSFEFLTNCFAQSAHNFKAVLLIDRTTLWQEFMMYHAIAIEENNKQNLLIWPNLTCFFRSWPFWTLPLGWLGFGFIVIDMQPWFVNSYDLFWNKSGSSLNIVKFSWTMSMQRCFCEHIEGCLLFLGIWKPQCYNLPTDSVVKLDIFDVIPLRMFWVSYFTKMEMVLLKLYTKAPKTKIMGLFTWLTNKQKYTRLGFNISRIGNPSVAICPLKALS